jgi:hypothetical protein
MPKVLKAVVEEVDQRPGVRCVCGKHHPFGAYGVAQMAMRHRVSLNCDECGYHVEVKRGATDYIITMQRPKKAKAA